MVSDIGERMCGDKGTKGQRKGRKRARDEDKIWIILPQEMNIEGGYSPYEWRRSQVSFDIEISYYNEIAFDK